MHIKVTVRSAGLMAVLAAVAACQAAAPAAPAASRHASAPSATATRTDVHACRDGRCRISVSTPATIPVDARFGFRSIRISVKGPEVTVAAAIPGGSLDDTVSVPGTATLNNLSIEVQALAGNRVTVDISPI